MQNADLNAPSAREAPGAQLKPRRPLARRHEASWQRLLAVYSAEGSLPDVCADRVYFTRRQQMGGTSYDRAQIVAAVRSLTAARRRAVAPPFPRLDETPLCFLSDLNRLVARVHAPMLCAAGLTQVPRHEIVFKHNRSQIAAQGKGGLSASCTQLRRIAPL